MTAAKKVAPRPGDILPIHELEVGTFVELLGMTAACPILGDEQDPPRRTTYVQIVAILGGRRHLRAWSLDLRRWSEMIPAEIGMRGRVVSRPDALATWGLP